MDFDKKLKLHQLSHELAGIEYRRQQLIQEIAGIENGLANYSETCAETMDRICNASSSKDKIKLFRGLFKGREDVYARRFESSKTGKSGYQPVCKNEWSVGICSKPSLKCANCNYREYLPLTDDVIERHLRGQTPNEPGYKDYVVGIYLCCTMKPVGFWQLILINRTGKMIYLLFWRRVTRLLFRLQ